MMNTEKSFMVLSGVILAGLLIIASVFFTVQEGQAALVLRIGEFKSNENAEPIVYRPGLHFKAPIIDKVVKLSAKIQSINEQATRILTKEQKPVEVDYFVKWRIKDFVKFYKATIAGSNGTIDLRREIDPQQAEYFIKNNVADVLRTTFGEKNLHDIISGERHDMLSELKDRSTEGAKTFGIEIIDVRVKKLDYPREISASVYQRMRTKRQQVANLYRANGKFSAERIKSNADKEYRLIIANAEKEAAKVIAEGDAIAADIYNESYQKSKKFYKLYRQLKAYRQSLTEKDFLVINPNDFDFFDLFSNQSTDKPISPVKVTEKVATR